VYINNNYIWMRKNTVVAAIQTVVMATMKLTEISKTTYNK